MYPDRSNFQAGASRSAWFYLASSDARRPTPIWFIVQTEGLRVIAGIQKALQSIIRDTADRARSNASLRATFVGPDGRFLDTPIAMTGRWDGPTIAALHAAMSAYAMDPQGLSALRAAYNRSEITRRVVEIGLELWVQWDASIRSPVDTAMNASYPAYALTAHLSPITLLPVFGQMPPVPLTTPMAPEFRVVPGMMEDGTTRPAGLPVAVVVPLML